MLKIVALAITTVVVLSSNEAVNSTLKGDLVENVSNTYVDHGKEWDLKYFKHDSFAEYMPKKEVPEIIEEYIFEEEVIEYEEEYVEEEVYSETIVEEVYTEVVETVEEVYEEPVYTNGTSFEATAYAVGGWAVPSTVTADGTDISDTIYSSSGYRIIAVDPSVIPMGTIVKVTYSDGTTFLAQASDTGGMIVGNRIDILYDNVNDALSFGRQNVIVEFIN